MKKSKSLTALIIFVILLLTNMNLGFGLENMTRQVNYNNETIEFKLLDENLNCSPQTTVIKISRLNYTTGINPLNIQYSFTVENDILNTTTRIDKTINKYSSAQTGNIPENTNGSTNIGITLNTTLIAWNNLFFCNLSRDNQSTQEAIGQDPLNSTSNQEINSSSHQQNNTAFNETIIPEENNSAQQNQTANSTNTTTSEKINQSACTNASIGVEKELYAAGEKISFWLESEPTEYTYWIEDLKGQILKDARTSTSMSKKSFTIKEYNAEEKIHIIKMNVATSCIEQLTKKIITINEDYEPSKEQNKQISCEEKITTTQKTSKETKMAIIKLERHVYKDKQYLITEIEIQKGATRKTKVSVSLWQDEKITPEYNLYVNSDTKTNTILYLPTHNLSGEMQLRIEGLGLQLNKTINIPQQETTQTLNTKTNSQSTPKTTATVVINQTTTPIYSQEEKTNNIRTLVLAAALVLLILGIFIGYGPKKITDKFIKK
jgi:hypothetical protein